jgi:SCP-2 sterol transfer family
MAEFLSPGWIADLDAAARHAVVPDDVGDLTVEQVVRDVPGTGEVRYHVRFAAGTARVVPGPATSPDVRVLADYESAVAMHRGHLSAQEALASGRAKLQGPIQGVRGREAALRGLDDAFASVRAATTYA